MNAPALMQTSLALPNPRHGKVRDVYACDFFGSGDGATAVPATLLVATDRLSAFDVVMPNGVPGKGKLLTSIAAFWFDLIEKQLGDAMPHHLLSVDARDLAGVDESTRISLQGRVMIGRRCRVVPIECVVRGYLAGSGFKDYRANGSVCGIGLPPGLHRSERLPEPIFTPASKAAEGHDENIGFDQAVAAVGGPVMEILRDRSLTLYAMAARHAEARGLILADTKFEFGCVVDSQGALVSDAQDLILIDEVLTPDSSRFWPMDGYEVALQRGEEPASIDKQYVRSYLSELVQRGQWNGESPGPDLPDEIIANTLTRYEHALSRLTGPAHWTGSLDRPTGPPRQ